jgi:hypothetical protein
MEALMLVAECGGPTMFAWGRCHESLEPTLHPRVQSEGKRTALGPAQTKEGPMTILVYVNTAKQVGDPDQIKLFATVDAAERWFEENDPEGVAFEYEVLE